jgi:hypothetical protein
MRTSALPLGALANSTCCSVHRNAEITYSGDSTEQGASLQVWIRSSKDVMKGEEVLVHYGDAYFREELCRCCMCSGRCIASTLSRSPHP